MQTSNNHYFQADAEEVNGFRKSALEEPAMGMYVHAVQRTFPVATTLPRSANLRGNARFTRLSVGEDRVKWNAINQHFLAHPVTPRHGEFAPPTLPGLGMDLDPAKIEVETEVYRH